MSIRKQPVRKKRAKTARELAEKYGVCRRTIVSMIAESRQDYEARARDRRKFVYEQRLKKVSYDVIAEKLNITKNAAMLLHSRAKKIIEMAR